MVNRNIMKVQSIDIFTPLIKTETLREKFSLKYYIHSFKETSTIRNTL